MARYLIPILFLFAALLPAQNQQPSAPSDTAKAKVFRVNVSLVQVDAVVTDKDDQPVTDLTVKDFIILQDGKPQNITNFSLVRVKNPDIPRPIAKKQAEKTGKDSIPPPLSVRIKPDQVQRVIAIVVDDLGLSFANTTKIREAVKKWINEEMQPGDLVAVIMTGRGLGSLEQFTGDRNLLHAAADRIRWNATSRVGSTSFTSLSELTALSPLLEEERSRGLMMGTLGSIRYVINGLEKISGRKSLIFFSESMQLHFDSIESGVFGMNLSELARDSMRRLIEDANRAAVVIHTIDPRGNSWGAYPDVSSADITASREGLFHMAEQTGGLSIYYRNHVDGVLRDVARDGEIYYLIGYQPDAKTIEEIQTGKTKYHNIRVRVKRPGLRVRSRSGFFTIPEDQYAPLTIRERMIQALQSPFVSDDLSVRLTALYMQTRENIPCINVLLHFDAEKLTFKRGPNGKQNTAVYVLGGIYDADGQPIDYIDKRWELSIGDAEYENFKRNGMASLMHVPVKKAGPYHMRIVLSDIESGRLGSASHFIEVPRMDKGRLALSGILLTADKSIAGMAGDRKEGILTDREINGTAAVRIFKPGDTILWAYQILNAKTGKDNKSQIQTYVRLFREGQEVFCGQPSDLTLEVQDNSERMLGTGRMRLGSLPPGIYDLQVIVLDMLAKEKHRMALQSIDFEVQDQKKASTETIKR